MNPSQSTPERTTPLTTHEVSAIVNHLKASLKALHACGEEDLVESVQDIIEEVLWRGEQDGAISAPEGKP
jgi:hypothetical protein